MAVDADPLAPRRDEEHPGVHQRHSVLELVDQAADLLGEFLLDVPPVRVPHGVEEPLPDLLHVEHVDVGPRAEPLAERAEGGVADVLLAVRELTRERVFTAARILRSLRLVRLALLLVQEDGRERRELIADARHVPLLLNVRFDLELHHGCRPSGYGRASWNFLFATRVDERDAAGARGEDSGDGFLSRLAGACDDDARGARCGTVAGDNTLEACRRVAKWKATAARLTLLLPPPRRGRRAAKKNIS